MKNFKGKCIYNPSGKAGEYSYWACNFYVGCSNGCTYCYCKKGIVAKQLGGNIPTLKKCFKDEIDAREIFTREVNLNAESLKGHGLFFSFTTDPFLSETIGLTIFAINYCNLLNIPVKILTKTGIKSFKRFQKYVFINGLNEKIIAYGVTLTGCDELESNAAPNNERVETLKLAKDSGFKTFVSLEPIIDFDLSLEMIYKTVEFCDLYKIGLESGMKYDRVDLLQFINHNAPYILQHSKVYWKDSILKVAGIDRNYLPQNCVNRDYNIFKG